MNLTKRIEAIEQALEFEEFSLEDRNKIKFFILAMSFSDLTEEEKESLSKIFYDAETILKRFDFDRKRCLICEISREIIQEKDSSDIEVLWREYTELELKWKNAF